MVSETIYGKELCPPLHLSVAAIKKGAGGSPSTTTTVNQQYSLHSQRLVACIITSGSFPITYMHVLVLIFQFKFHWIFSWLNHLSSNNLHLQSFSASSILPCTNLVLKALFWVALANFLIYWLWNRVASLFLYLPWLHLHLCFHIFGDFVLVNIFCYSKN